MKPFLIVLSAAVVVLSAICVAHAEHPQVLVTPADRATVRAKIETAPWARTAFAKRKMNVDRYVKLCEKDPTFVTSRLFLNWKAHYIQPIVEKERWVRGEGQAPVPTPRFAGARDWETRFSLPGNIEDFRPYNDALDGSGKVWMLDKTTKKGEWTEPGVTGRNIEVGNARILELAADASFVYWVTGEEKYARFASNILWTYMDGFQHVRLPRALDGKTRVIGYTSFEVIHESIMPHLGLAYDFLYDYLRKQGRDVGMIQTQLKRMTDRVIEGGNPDGNWNLNQANNFVYPGLAVEENGAYADGKGRQYYVDVLLNARLPAQTGLSHVIEEGYDKSTALWPEAPGYGFGTTPQVVRISSLLLAYPAAKALLDNPLLVRAVLAQCELLYPNGYAVGIGDTTSTRINAGALEQLIAIARKRGDAITETRLTAALQREIDGGFYNRAAQSDIASLIQYVPELKPSPSGGAAVASRTFFGEPLNVFLQRNVADSADPEHGLATAMFGTKGGHVHSNGLAIELYGAGLIQGADPGRGSSYWQPEHGDYYRAPLAHNTVIVNGKSTYPENKKPQCAMTLTAMEPKSGTPALSPAISFATASFAYDAPVAAEQQRTLAVVRTGPKSGFYFDVFRSHTTYPKPGDFHDYLYHNMGQSLAVSGPEGNPLSLAPSQTLATQAGLLKGYTYFKNERSTDATGDFRATFTVKLAGGSERVMGLWMPGSVDRRVFTLEAPQNRAVRAAMAPEFSTMPMPTLLVRQLGDAWTRPFVGVFEPYIGAEGTSIRTVRALPGQKGDSGMVACMVEGKGYSAFLAQDAAEAPQLHVREGYTFQAAFGVVLTRNGAVSELYLGRGIQLAASGVKVASESGKPIGASLRRNPDGKGWLYSADAPIIVTLPGGKPVTLPVAQDKMLPEEPAR